MKTHRYRIYLAGEGHGWSERKEQLETNFYRVLNRVVSLSGVIEVGKFFNVSESFFVFLDSESISEINKMEEVLRIEVECGTGS